MRILTTTRSLSLAMSAMVLAGCCCARVGTRAATPTALPERNSAQSANVAQQVNPTPEPTQIFVDMTVLHIREQDVASTLGALFPIAATEHRVLSDAQVQALHEALRAHPDARTTQAPKLLALENQEATIFIGESIRFGKTDPKTLSITEDPQNPLTIGFHLRAIAQLQDGGSNIALDLHQHWRAIKDGVTDDAIARADAATFLREMTIEQKIDTTLVLEDGGHALVGSPDVFADKQGRHVRVALVSARALTADQTRKQ